MTKPSEGPLPVNGKVVRLHFACRASLPYGSTLHVTSSALWAPSVPLDTSLEADDDDYNNGLPSRAHGAARDTKYASSVEMVTSPEAYPLWRTRTPVIIVANHSGAGAETDSKTSTHGDGEAPRRGGVLRHRYRYMVVTPGADIQSTNAEEAIKEELAGITRSLSRGSSNVSSSESLSASPSSASSNVTGFMIGETAPIGLTSANDAYGADAFPVMMWEDPFVALQQQDDDGDDRESSHSRTHSRAHSINSMQSAVLPSGQPTKSLSDLPYRTLEIDTSSLSSAAFGKVVMTSSNEDDANNDFTGEGVRIDTWNDPTDFTFRPFVHHEKALNQARLLSAAAILSDDIPSDDEQQNNSDNPANSEQKRMFLVCYHLPVLLSKDPSTSRWSACWSESLIAKTEQSGVTKSYDTRWFGTVSPATGITTVEERDAVREVLKPMGCTPLFLDDVVGDIHYLGMCKQVLWPAFHNIDLLDLSQSGWGQRGGYVTGSNTNTSHGIATNSSEAKAFTESDWDQSRLDGWWSAYVAVNNFFAEAIAAEMKPQDTVWVHDYHLCLLPKLLDDADRAQTGRRTIHMVFFLHIPFPTSQVFRELEHGEDILEGMLHADVVGFHAFDHARHFLNAAKRILGLTYESLVGGLIGVRYRGIKVLVTISNVSIESDVVESAMELSSVKVKGRELKQKHNGRSIIAGVDIAQKLSGVSLKLLAYERLLTDYPVWHSKVVMVQKCLVPGTRRADEADTLHHVRSLVRRIQKNFGSHVIDYEEIVSSSLPIDQRLAIWSAADVFMVTPIREGLNLQPLEYVFARKAPATPGVTIASEFSAVQSILNGALRVNPFDIQMTSTCMDKALQMDMAEREGRRERDIQFVSSSPSGLWTRNVLRDLRDATLATQAEQGTDGRGSYECDHARDKMEGVDAAAAKVLGEIDFSLAALDVAAVKAAYDASSNRVLVLDFNGTIVLKEPPGKYLKRDMLGTSGNKPPAEVTEALKLLCSDPRNTVYVVSGDTQRNLEDALGNIVGLGLAAGNGGCFASPLQEGDTEHEWNTLDLGVDWSAVKKAALPVLSKYTARTNGSFVKLTNASIGWSYYSCDPEWGSMQALHLVPELERELHAFDVRFVTLKGVIEVVPRKLNKGLVVKKVLTEVAAASDTTGKCIDFILCLGDDISDEKMFTAVFSSIAEQNTTSDMQNAHFEVSKTRENAIYAYTVVVGKKASHASYYVDGANDVANLLVTIAGVKSEEDSTSSCS